MKLLKEHKEKISKLNNQEFKTFLEEFEKALILEPQTKDDFFSYYEDANGNLYDLNNTEEAYDAFEDELSLREIIMYNFSQTRDIEKLCDDIDYIKSSHYLYKDFEDGEIGASEFSKKFEEDFSMDLVKDIICFNSEGIRYNKK